MSVNKFRTFCDDSPVRIRPPVSKHDDIPRERFLRNLCSSTGEHDSNEAFIITVHHPISGVRPRVRVRRAECVLVNPDKDHTTIDAVAPLVAIVMVFGANPTPGLNDDFLSLDHGPLPVC